MKQKNNLEIKSQLDSNLQNFSNDLLKWIPFL